MTATRPDDAAAVLVARAAFLEARGSLEAAESLYRQALDVYALRPQVARLDIAVALNNLAQIRDAQGRGAEAADLHRRSLAMKLELVPAPRADIFPVLARASSRAS